VFSVASEANPKIDEEALIDAGYNLSNGKVITGFLMPHDLSSWFSVSDCDTTIPGKIKIDFNIPASFVANQDRFDIEFTRTYRYGGGYRGHNAVDYGERNLQSHVDLFNPNPITTPWEKTIELYSSIGGGDLPEQIIDTQYDVADNGEKLIAVRNKEVKPLNAGIDYDGYGTTTFAWYQRTQSHINNYPSTYEIVDANDEFEWHYLIWDWVLRKYMQHPDNPRYSTITNKFHRFDFEEATACDYRLKITLKADPSVNMTSPVKQGWAALTAREFAGLGAIIRDIAFHSLPTTFADELLNAKDNQPPQNNMDVAGRFDGRIRAWDLQAGTTVKGKFASTDGVHGKGIADFPGMFMKFSWTDFQFSIGIGDHSPKRVMNGTRFDFYTPKFEGYLAITGDLLAGTFYHGLHNTNGGAKFLATVKVVGQSSNYLDAVDAGYKYPGEWMGGGWRRAYDNPAKWYNERFTSIKWKYLNQPIVYPGCLENPNPSNPWE
ncbi:MAG: hypothetical protein JXR63_10800, partial [Spirochaetales bacterium]|nr:hypothetical protein [Spirochaetales bacterium]